MKSCSRKILQLFYNANHSGRIIKPDAIGRIGEDTDGLVIELSWRVENGVIIDAKFRAFGNPNAIAITSLVTDKLIGKTVEQSLELDDNILLEELGELLPEYIEVFDMVKLAIEETYGNYLKKQNRKALQGIEDSNKENVLEEVEIEPVSEPVETETSVAVSEEQQLQNYIENSVFTPSKQKVEGEKRGRGRPRKIVEETEQTIVGEKRGRGRPRKPVDETIEPAPVGEKKGRGRPKKVVEISEVEVVAEKRGRGRPKKIVEEVEQVEIGEKRGRGRPRKIVEETEQIVVGEKRGRGRPRKPVDETIEPAPVGEKKGRGRPRKNAIAQSTLETAERQNYGGRIRIETLEEEPKDLENEENSNNAEIQNKENVNSAEVVESEKVDENKHSSQNNGEREKFVEKLITNNVLVDDEFDTNYDLFKSNIRSIFSGQSAKEEPSKVNSNINETNENLTSKAEENQDKENLENEEFKAELQQITVEEKRGRGRPRKIVEATDEVVVGEKRGRGRPRKIVEETDEIVVGEKRGRGRPKKIVEEVAEVEVGEKRGRGRPRLDSINSLTRSLSANSGVSSFNNTQDIVFASKNVTTTNINVNVTKTVSNYTETSESPVVKYTTVQNNEAINSAKQNNVDADELNAEVEDGEVNIDDRTSNLVDDNNEVENANNETVEEVDASNVKDEAPNGLADLLKALLNDD